MRLMVAFVGARNKVYGLACILTQILSANITSLLRDTKEFLFNVSICALVGIPFRKDA